MTNMDFSILKWNISMLMAQADMSQQDLADLLGMSQSGVSKCLKPDDESRRFTLEQVCVIADHFNVSLDDLVGRAPEDRQISAKEICQLFATLIQKYRVVRFPYQVDEVVYEHDYPSYEFRPRKRARKYIAFYFPDHLTAPGYLDEYRLDEWSAEFSAGGNDLPDNMKINNFLQKFIDAFEKHDSGVYDDEDYKILVDAYFKILNK